MGYLFIKLDFYQSREITTSQPISQGKDTKLEAKGPPPTYSTYTGSGTPRIAQETLWRRDLTGGNATKNFPFIIDLPGTGYWTGTRLDLTVNDILEEKDWMINGNFNSGLTNWIKNEDPIHTGPAISIGTDISYPKDKAIHGNAADFRFASAYYTPASPPQSSSTDPDNTGDFGASTHWTNSTDLGGGTPHKYTTGTPPGGTPQPSRTQGWANWRVSKVNSSAIQNNRDGAWMFYIADTEAAAQAAGTPQVYTVTFQTTYTYSFNTFPVLNASLKFDYRYYSTDFNKGNGNPSWDTDPQYFTLNFSVYTASEQLLDRQVITWSCNAGTNPGDSGWVHSPVYNLTKAGLFHQETGGSNFRVVFKLVVRMDVDDGQTTDTHTWCSDSYSDHNNEDSDYLFFYLDGVELNATVPQIYGADVSPDLTQTINFNRRNATNGYCQFYYYMPLSFLSGESADNSLYLDVIINSKAPHRYSIATDLTRDSWAYKKLDWATISGDIGANPGPITFNITFRILFTASGWYAKGYTGQSIWIDDTIFPIQTHVNASIAKLNCYDEEHGNALIPWDYRSEHTNRLMNYSTWQTITTSSRFWLNTTSTAKIWLSSVEIKFYAASHYQTVTPIFSLPTDLTGWTNTVTWKINYFVNAISSGWNYTIAIPSIPNWASNDWNVSSVIDSLYRNINFRTIPTAESMKNISISTTTADAAGTWVVTCTSPNKITNFNVTNQINQIKYEYYTGFNNKTRIGFTTATRYSASSVIWVNYTKPDGSPVAPIYPNTTIQPAQSYIMPYWNISTTALANDHYIAIVKWLDTDAFNDEVGFAAHYICIIHNVSVSSISFLQKDSNLTSNYVISGATLRISVNITDPVISPCLPLENATITFYYPKRNNPTQIGSKTEVLIKNGNGYQIDLDTSGKISNKWINSSTWMGMTGNRTFIIKLYGNSTFLNKVYSIYQITGWFYLIVDTQYKDQYIDTREEAGQTLYLKVSLVDNTWAHQPGNTGILDSEKINNRQWGFPITDFYPLDGKPDTWNQTVTIRWAIIKQNLTYWCGGDIARKNDPQYKWNGTLDQVSGFYNEYFSIITIPINAFPSESYGKYYINITTTFKKNEWGWITEPQYMTLFPDKGQNGIIGDYDDHLACLSFEVELPRGVATGILPESSSTWYWWHNSSQPLTRLYIWYYNDSKECGRVGFNSTLLASCDAWNVSSYVYNEPRAPVKYFGDSSSTAVNWKHVDSTTNLPDSRPDPHRENLGNNKTWGWFYYDFNWTKVSLGLGDYDYPPMDILLQIKVLASIKNCSMTKITYQRAHGDFYITIKPNRVELTIALEYPSGTPTFLDANYYGSDKMTSFYYWGDMLNFTINAWDSIDEIRESGISLQYKITNPGVTTSEIKGILYETNQPGRYTAILNTSDPKVGLTAGDYVIDFQGIRMNHSILILERPLALKQRIIWLNPEKIAGVFMESSVYNYNGIADIMNIGVPRVYIPYSSTFRTIANHTIAINVTLFDYSPRNGGSIYTANMYWELRYAGKTCLKGWTNNSINGIFCLNIDLNRLYINSSDWMDNPFYLRIKPFKTNYYNELDQYPSGATWIVPIRIGHKPLALIPLTPMSMTYSQSNWKYHPIQFVVIDPITGEYVTGCKINWTIEGTNYHNTSMEEYAPGHYQVIFDTWPSLFQWIAPGQYRLSAAINSAPDPIYKTAKDGWKISELQGDDRPFLTVESEGFLGPLSVYFYIILGVVAAAVGGYYSYKSYKFLTTPYVIRKIEESIDKISKDKKVAAGVMKSRDHLIFLEATELLKVVGVVLRPPPEKKLPPPIEKVIPKRPAEELEKIPEIPMEIVSMELDKVGVRPEEKPILIQQIKELGPEDRREFIESLIGEDRFKQLVEELKAKAVVKKE